MIWLIDYTHYELTLDPQLAALKADYYLMKSHIRYQKIGNTAPVKTKVYALGLLRLATILSRNGVLVEYMHYDELIRRLNDGCALPETIAFSVVCPTVPRAADLCRRVKAASPKTKVLLGGSHVNVAAEVTKERFPEFDGLVVGYEYEAAEKLAGRVLKRIEGGYVDFSLLPNPLVHYAVNTFTAMGCPFACNYCVDGRAPHFSASPDGQLGEMKALLPERNLVHFFDSVLGYSREGIESTCRAIKDTGHKFLLSCDMRADILTPKLVRLMEDAGFVEIRLGMDSADSGVLENNGRTLFYEKFLESLKMIRENSGLYVALYNLVGMPSCSVAAQENTILRCDELLSSHLTDEIKTAFYVPYPMNGVDYAKRGVRLLTEDWAKYDRQSRPVFDTAEQTADELWETYIHVLKRINESWLSANGFASFSDVPPHANYYGEYIEEQYIGIRNRKK